MKFNRITIVFLLPIFIYIIPTAACTVAVVSGKCTPDGRPLLWKHRDTDKLQNALMYFTDGKYPFIGLINSDDSLCESVWIGCNKAGFAIMNSASYNLILKDTIEAKDREGIVMKLALQQCATLEDFERLLQQLPRPLGVQANYGVIDAQGGAAFYEVDNFTYRKLDVNDSTVAPFGYLVHTNFSFTGDPKSGAGHIRFATAEALFHEAYESRNITPRFLLQKASRCLKHSLTEIDLAAVGAATTGDTRFAAFEDFIPRFSTSASVVVQGVRPGESTDFAALWTILGHPLTSVITPVWLGGTAEFPALLKISSAGVAPLCEKAMTLKKRLFPIQRSYGERYINVAALINSAGTGILQQLKPLDNRIFEEAEKRLEGWRKDGKMGSDVTKFYHWMEDTIQAEYKRLFGL
jgi:uncharacterized lipoprotein NlpE involved in copper resistance